MMNLLQNNSIHENKEKKNSKTQDVCSKEHESEIAHLAHSQTNLSTGNRGWLGEGTEQVQYAWP